MKSHPLLIACVVVSLAVPGRGQARETPTNDAANVVGVEVPEDVWRRQPRTVRVDRRALREAERSLTRYRRLVGALGGLALGFGAGGVATYAAQNGGWCYLDLDGECATMRHGGLGFMLPALSFGTGALVAGGRRRRARRWRDAVRLGARPVRR